MSKGRVAIEKAAAILHVAGLRLVQVDANASEWRELDRDPKVEKTLGRVDDPELLVPTCSGRVRIT